MANALAGGMLNQGSSRFSLRDYTVSHCAAELFECVIKQFADDTKCFMIVESDEEHEMFQLMLDNLSSWSSEWETGMDLRVGLVDLGPGPPHFGGSHKISIEQVIDIIQILQGVLGSEMCSLFV